MDASHEAGLDGTTLGEASSGDGGSCGALSEPCCANSTCAGTLSCRNGSCGNAPANGTGTPCSKNSDCPSGICQPVGNGDVCTTTCTTVTNCVAGWTCQAEIGQSGDVCQCTSSPEVCDGKDNDCDGIVDNEPAVDAACEAMTPGDVCVNGSCTCKTTCGGATCVDTTTNVGNCGACGMTCPTGGICHAGTCGCPGGETACGGACVGEQKDPNNCGGCGTVCPAAQTCQSGSCACPLVGESLCGSACVNELTDPNNCGGCATKCTATGQTCEGACVCPAGGTVCSGACVNEQTDDNNCGGCGTQCTVTGQSCQKGACACPSGDTSSGGVCCPAGESGCAGTCASEQTDPNNCGGCGITCPGGTCSAGKCIVTLTVMNADPFGSCLVTINGAVGTTAPVAAGSTVTIVASPPAGGTLATDPWFGIDQDDGGAAPGTDVGTGTTETSTATVTIGNGATQCVSVCCFPKGANPGDAGSLNFCSTNPCLP